MPDQAGAGAPGQPDWMPFAMPEHVLAPPTRSQVAAQRPSAPSTISTAATLMIMRAGLAALAFLALLYGRDSWRAQLERDHPLASPGSVDSLISTTLMTTAFSTALFAWFYVLRSSRIRAGSNRARVMTMVLAGLGIASVAYSVSRPAPMVWKAAMGVDVVLDVSIIVLLAMPASAAWCRRRGR